MKEELRKGRIAEQRAKIEAAQTSQSEIFLAVPPSRRGHGGYHNGSTHMPPGETRDIKHRRLIS